MDPERVDSEGNSLVGLNDNGVPVRSILLTIWDDTFEDSALLGNSRNLMSGSPDGPYDFIGADSDRTVNPFAGVRHGINYFRLGDLENSATISSSFQRRIVIANGSNRELLFSLTPTGTSDGLVREQVTSERDNMLAAINSVSFTAEEPVAPIDVTSIEVEPGTIAIEFTNNPGATDFTIFGSTDLADTDPQNLNEFTIVNEISAGVFRAVVDVAEVEPRMFFWISR